MRRETSRPAGRFELGTRPRERATAPAWVAPRRLAPCRAKWRAAETRPRRFEVARSRPRIERAARRRRTSKRERDAARGIRRAKPRSTATSPASRIDVIDAESSFYSIVRRLFRDLARCDTRCRDRAAARHRRALNRSGGMLLDISGASLRASAPRMVKEPKPTACASTARRSVESGKRRATHEFLLTSFSGYSYSATLTGSVVSRRFDVKVPHRPPGRSW